MKRILKLIPIVISILIMGRIYAQSSQPQVIDGFYERKMHKEKGVIPYDPVREADVFWQKRIWRVIDIREKMNLAFSYPKERFIQILLNATESGEVTAYNGIDDQFTSPMTPEEVGKIGRGTDTVFVMDPETFEEKMEVVQNELDMSLIKKFRLKEDWFFDKESSTLQVRIIGIAPILDKYDDNGNYIGEQVMFWVYYPNLRQTLANHEVVNRFNDAARMTWYDLFETRFFSSYIIKESNELDRRIQDYKSGVQALLEAEKIKNDIFKWEHDVWTY